MPPKKSVQLSGVVVAQTELCSIDADRGILRYRGYDIADLAEHASYEEVAYLPLEGDLPDADERAVFEEELAERELPRPVEAVKDRKAHDATPMEMLRTAVSQLSFYDPAEVAIDTENDRRKAARLIAQLPTIVARHHRLRSDEEPIPPDQTLPYAENFLTMLRGRTPTEAEARAFEVAMILHAEHELNASTFAARVVAGTGADLHSAIVAAICALKGPTHGGANEAAMRMIAGLGSPEQIPEGVRERLAAKQTLFGFGHPMYTTTDPRARILKRLAEELSQGGGERDWYARTDATERAVHEQKGLHPNVDLWSGPLYRYLGIPEDLFTPLFECSRVAGQAAHVLEQHANNKIIRPAADYIGPESREYPIAARRTEPSASSATGRSSSSCAAASRTRAPRAAARRWCRWSCCRGSTPA